MLREILSYLAGSSVVVAIGGLVAYAIRRYVADRVAHQFDLRIENHKHELQRIAERERFDLQRRLAGASLYLEKQHAAAAEIYVAVRNAEGAFARVFAPMELVVLDGCNEDDLRRKMAGYKILEGRRDKLLAMALADPEKGARALEEEIARTRVPVALNELRTAANLIVLNAIYFSGAADEALTRFVDVSQQLINTTALRPPDEMRIDPGTRKDLHEAVARVNAALRTELSDPPIQLTRDTSPDQAAGIRDKS